MVFEERARSRQVDHLYRCRLLLPSLPSVCRLMKKKTAAQPAATTPISSAPQRVEEGDGGVEERATDEIYRLKRRDQETQDDECGVQSEARGLPECTRKFTNGDWSLD